MTTDYHSLEFRVAPNVCRRFVAFDAKQTQCFTNGRSVTGSLESLLDSVFDNVCFDLYILSCDEPRNNPYAVWGAQGLFVTPHFIGRRIGPGERKMLQNFDFIVRNFDVDPRIFDDDDIPIFVLPE